MKINVIINFNNHIPDLSWKASQKISALARIISFMRFRKKKLLMNVFFISYFSYHRVMCHSRTNNRKKKTSFMKRCLKILYNGEQSIVVLLFEFFRPIIKTVYHETEAISYFAPKILDIPLEKLRNIENLENSRTKIKTFFSTGTVVPHGQCWTNFDGEASLSRC